MIHLFCDNEHNWLHHAFVARNTQFGDLYDVFEKLGYSEHDSDIRHFKETLLSIEMVRSAIEAAYVKPLTDRKRVVILEAESVSLPAQNALLKLLEEPPQDTVIVLLLPQGIPLLPTVESRIYEVVVEHNKSIEEIESFLHQAPAERLATWSPYAEDKGLLRTLFAAVAPLVSHVHCEKDFLEVSDAFVKGLLAPKYAFEALCLLVPTKVTDQNSKPQLKSVKV